MKNYIGFVNDHSGSMTTHRSAAIKDYNTNIGAVRDAASREMQDTVVSVVGVGVSPPGRYRSGADVYRQVQISNPHVLKPIDTWSVDGGTPLYDGIADMINLLKDLPDANKEDVSFLVMITTDGEEMHSRQYTEATLKKLIAEVSVSGRWTFVMRVPKKSDLSKVTDLGIPLDNIQKWDTTSSQGMAQTTQANTTAMSSFFTQRASGARSSSTFYSNAAQVDTGSLTDISKKVSLYVVPEADNGIEIRPFILRHRMEHLKGSAFYQLTKTEARVQPDKQVIIRHRANGKMYSGPEARKMIGLPDNQNARLHPGDHSTYDIFIQSNSVNRKLVAGTGVVYWKDIGTPFTEADLAYLQPKPIPAKTAVAQPVQLPPVAGRTSPTKSPIPVTPRGPTVGGKQVTFYPSRDEAREANRGLKPVRDLKQYAGQVVTGNVHGERWFIFN